MSRETVAMAKGVHLHNGDGPGGMSADDTIVMAGNVAMLRAQVEAMTRNVTECRRQLEAANERARVLAADLSRLAQENAAQASALHKANHTVDELRRQLRLANRDDAGHARPVTLTDRGGDGDGYCAYADAVME